MRTHSIVLILATLLLPITLPAADPPASSQPVPREKPLALNDHAPDFSLQTLDHKTVTLSDLLKSGPVVVVNLRGWVTYQCPICTRQTGELIAHAKEILAQAPHVVFIYPGPAADLQAHAKEFLSGKGIGDLPDGYSFVMDPDMKTISAWGLRWNKEKETVYPSTFIINPDGTVRFAKISHSHGDRATSADLLKSLNQKP